MPEFRSISTQLWGSSQQAKSVQLTGKKGDKQRQLEENKDSIIEWISQGLSDSEVSKQLEEKGVFVSAGTVRNFRLEKLGWESNRYANPKQKQLEQNKDSIIGWFNQG